MKVPRSGVATGGGGQAGQLAPPPPPASDRTPCEIDADLRFSGRKKTLVKPMVPHPGAKSTLDHKKCIKQQPGIGTSYLRQFRLNHNKDPQTLLASHTILDASQ